MSAEVAKRAVQIEVGKICKFKPKNLQMALKTDKEAQKFTLSRMWTPICTTLKLSAGSFATLHANCLVADASLTSEDILIGLAIFRLFGVGTKTLLEEHRDPLK